MTHGKNTRPCKTSERLTDPGALEEEFRLIFMQSSVGKAQADPHTGHFLRVNPALCNLLGYSEEELLQRSFLDVTHPDDRASDWSKLHELVAGRITSFQSEKRYLRRDGSIAWGQATVNLVRDANGRPLRTMAMIQDITEQKRAAEALAASERQYRELVETANSVILRWTPDGIIRFVNDFGLRFFGYSAEELIGRPVSLLLPPEQRGEGDQMPALVRDIVRHPQKYGSVSNRNLTRSGETVWVSWTNKAIIDKDGQLQEILAIGNDITEQMRIEEARRKSEELLRLFIEYAPSALAMFDRDMRYLYTSHRWRRDYGLGDLELTGKSHYEIFPEIPPTWRTAHRRGLAGEVLGSNGERFERVDGSVQWIAWEIRPWYLPDGTVGGIVLFSEDITERKLAEQALQKAQEELERRVEQRTAELREKDRMLLLQNRQAAMGEMINNIAHQWRQPLNALGLTLQTLPYLDRDAQGPEGLEAMVERAMGTILFMSRTIDDFRSYFKPDKAKVEFPLSQPLERTIRLVEGSFQTLGIDLRVDAAGDPLVLGYPNEFAQVLLNLLLNARDALVEREVGEPRIQIAIREEKECAVVTITDNAGGIEPEILAKVFEPYFTTKGPDIGTGIGLFMAKTIIEKNMDGQLTARNTVDGAEFRIEI